MYPFATRRHVYQLGIQAAALRSTGSAVTADASTNRLTLRGHGLVSDDLVTFEASAGGALPAPLSASTPYYAIVDSTDLFRVSATEGGSAVDLTTAGTGLVLVVPDAGARIDAALEAGADEIIAAAIAHKAPFETVPGIVTLVNLRLAVEMLIISGGLANPTYRESVAEHLRLAADAREHLKRWRSGVPITGLVDATPSVSEAGAVSWGETKRGWSEVPL